MNQTNHKPNTVLKYLTYLLFFLFGTFYLFWYTNYVFFYQEKSSLFLVSFTFLIEQLNQPGGFLEYLGLLQSSLYYYALVGAVLISLEIVAIIWIISITGKRLTDRSLYFLPFLIGSLLFYLQTNYQYLSVNNLGILTQLVLFYLVLNCRKKRFQWIPVILFPAIYFLFGSFSYLFLVLITIYLFIKKSWLKLIGIWFLGIVFIIIGKEIFFFQTTDTLIAFPFSIQNIGGQVKLFTIAIGLIMLMPVLFRFEIKVLSNLSLFRINLTHLTPFFIIVILIFLVIPRIDKKNSHYFHVEKLFYEKKYDELIQFNRQFPSSNTLTLFLNNVALTETGRLTEELFNFPQSRDGTTLFLKWEIVSEVLKRGGHFYYSIGMINEAQRWAYEYMVMKGYTPEALKLMIKTDLIKGKPEIAEKYISILEKSLFYRKEASIYRELLENRKRIYAHSELGWKKQLDVKSDFFVISEDAASNLEPVIKSDSTNIPAIEYKLAWLMLQKDMKGIVAMLPMMEKAGYTRIPKNVEEAVVTYKLLKVGPMPKLKTLQINPQTEQRFQQYYSIYQQNQSNKQMAYRALSREFANTYWFYVFFN